MSDGVKGFLTVLVATAMGALVGLGIGLGAQLSFWYWLVLAGACFGLLYGLEAGILLSYDLNRGVGWLALLVDMTWSLPNTVFGFVLGNLVYIFFGNPDRNASRGNNWIVFTPRGSSGFGHSVLQTLGTVNLGGAGQHELMHVLQARIFGPAYLALFAVFYIVTFILQLLWTATLGWILKVAGARQTAWFTPPPQSAVQGFFGWIYYATPFELWAYASGNP